MRCGVALAFLAGALHLAAPLSLLADEPACEGLSIPDGCPDPPDATSNCGCDWFEDFESYPPGEIPPADPADPLNPVSNGWAEWYNNPGHLGEIDDAQDHTTGAGQSMRIDQGDDQVRWFLGRGLRNDGFGYDADVYPFWIFEAYVFIPDDHTDDHYLIMNSHYPRFPDDPDSLDFTCWHLQLEFNGRYDFVCNSLFLCFPGGPRLDLVRGRWA